MTLTSLLSYASYGLELSCAIVGMCIYFRLPTAWRVVHGLTIIAFATEISAKAIIDTASNQNTQWLYNLYMLADGTLLAVAAILILRHRLAAVLGGAGIAVCCGVWAYQAATQPLIQLFTTAFVSQCLLLTALYLSIPIRAAFSGKVTLGRSEIFLCTANVLYSGCNIPRFAIFHYLLESGNSHFFTFVLPIVNILSVLRYGFILAGFLTLPRRSTNEPGEELPHAWTSIKSS